MGTVLGLLAGLLWSDTSTTSEPAQAEPVAYVAAEQPEPAAEEEREQETRQEDGRETENERAGEPERWSGEIQLPGITLGFSIELINHEPAGYTEPAFAGTIDIPMQNVKDLPLSGITRTGSQLSFTAPLPGLPENNWPKWELSLAETADGTKAEGLLRQSGGEFSTVMKLLAEGEAAPSQARPQEPKPPFPYRTTEVTVPTEAGHTLAGTLTLPAEGTSEDDRYPTAVFITGSGAQDRDESLMGHKPFAVLADHLARRGIASLRCDDRGTASSTGDFASATSLDFADDVRAQLAFLAGHESVASLGLIGHSEGGLIAPLVAAESDEVDWLVLLAGTGVPGVEVMGAQVEAIARSAAATVDEERLASLVAAQQSAFKAAIEEDSDAMRAHLRTLVEMQMAEAGIDDAGMIATAVDQQVAMLNAPWFRTFMTLDPRPSLRKTTQPVLVLNGGLDVQVLAEQNVPEIEQALQEAGNTDVEVHVLEGLNHLFQPAETGAPGEYATIETTFDPGALEIISGWIRRR